MEKVVKMLKRNNCISRMGRLYLFGVVVVSYYFQQDAQGLTIPSGGGLDIEEDKNEYDSKIELWLRGAFSFGEDLNKDAFFEPWKVGPVRSVRQRMIQSRRKASNCEDLICQLRGGSSSDGGSTLSEEQLKIQALEKTLGPDFVKFIELNTKEHDEDCELSCKSFYCAPNDGNDSSRPTWDKSTSGTEFTSYSFGATPPEDYASEFEFPLDLIHVTNGEPLFSAAEAASVINMAEAEGVHENQYVSGKYRLGGDWLVNLPNTRQWFNEKLETTLFPVFHHLFPNLISSPAVLRAHSVSLLKYNSTHPRTDVHIDNGILAMTLAMTPPSQYNGGGTFFEHMTVDHIIHMDVGHGTFRPGSVRHGAHPVTSGTRYILGAFLLLSDHVEHVRRLKNRGAQFRTEGNLESAITQFRYALAINPQCTTCLKDWAEILLTQKKFVEAEGKIRQALELLEDRDSDALFTLGLILSEQGDRDDESIDAYRKSIELNAEDAELCYNLGIKYGETGDKQSEMTMYARAVQIDPKFSGAWINWGTTLAELEKFDDAEVMFLKALACGDTEVSMKATMNLALVLQRQANAYATGGQLPQAKTAMQRASKYLDDIRPTLKGDYVSQFATLRVSCHRLMGSILAGLQQFDECETEFRKATADFPNIPGVWEMLARVLEIQGKSDEARQARQRLENF